MDVGFHYWLMTIICATLAVCVLSVPILWWFRGRLTAGKPKGGVTTLLALNLGPSCEGEGVEGIRALVVTAHPDDECMFFAPTILALSAECACQPFLLCLSEGDYYGQGNIRRQELVLSASVLGIPSHHVQLISDRQLPDDPRVVWNEVVIGQHILAAVRHYSTNTIVTFDEWGVSRHPNHTAISKAVRRLCQQNMLQTAGITQVLLLETTNIVRKYASWLDVLWSMASARHHVHSSFTGYLQAKRAMQAHRSQYKWFRKLYVAFSRYMIVNTFRSLSLVNEMKWSAG